VEKVTLVANSPIARLGQNQHLAVILLEEGKVAAEEVDSELQAIATLVATLHPLDPNARTRVINYVFEKLGIAASRQAVRTLGGPIPEVVAEHNLPLPALTPAGTADIRSLKDKKNPKTATEMVAVMAYYLANEASPAERSDTIGPDDIKKYFMQANFPLPKTPSNMTLVNTKNAGYLDARGDGRYSLNAVGHNLVVHKLPIATGASIPRKSRKKPPGKKTVGKSRRRSKK
jgi:hypothetical protein